MHPKYSECKCVVLHAHHIATIGDGRNGKKKRKKNLRRHKKKQQQKTCAWKLHAYYFANEFPLHTLRAAYCKLCVLRVCRT